MAIRVADASPRVSGIREALPAPGIEQMRLLRTRAQRDALALLRRIPRLGTGDQARLLAVDLGAAKHIGIRADVLDDLDASRDAVTRNLERLGPHADDEPPVSVVRHRHVYAAERRRPVVDLDAAEVHCRRTDEPGDEERPGPFVKLPRRPDLLELSLVH